MLQGNAPGFKFETLLKMRDMRTTNFKMSMLHYFIDHLEKNAKDVQT